MAGSFPQTLTAAAAARRKQQQQPSHSGRSQDAGGRDETACDSARLLTAAQAGDIGAAGRLLEPHVPALLALCRGITGHAEEAEDAVQETLYRALRGLHGFRGNAQVRTWLTRIAVNVCLEQRRRRSPLPRAASLDALPHDILWSHDAAPSPERDVVARVFLEEALSVLRPPQRAVWLLKEMEGRSLFEIAEATGWSVPRVKVELYRTRRALTAYLRRRDDEERETVTEEKRR